jgi:hypothetical protein
MTLWLISFQDFFSAGQSNNNLAQYDDATKQKHTTYLRSMVIAMAKSIPGSKSTDFSIAKWAADEENLAITVAYHPGCENIPIVPGPIAGQVEGMTSSKKKRAAAINSLTSNANVNSWFRAQQTIVMSSATAATNLRLAQTALAFTSDVYSPFLSRAVISVHLFTLRCLMLLVGQFGTPRVLRAGTSAESPFAGEPTYPGASNDPIDNKQKSKDGTPSWVWIIVGVAGGVLVIAALIVVFLCCCRTGSSSSGSCCRKDPKSELVNPHLQPKGDTWDTQEDDYVSGIRHSMSMSMHSQNGQVQPGLSLGDGDNHYADPTESFRPAQQRLSHQLVVSITLHRHRDVWSPWTKPPHIPLSSPFANTSHEAKPLRMSASPQSPPLPFVSSETNLQLFFLLLHLFSCMYEFQLESSMQLVDTCSSI